VSEQPPLSAGGSLEVAAPELPLDSPPPPLLPFVPASAGPPLLVPLLPPLEPASMPPSPAPPSTLAAVTVIVRVVLATPSPPVPAPLAAMPATHIVIVPLVFGAMNENVYVPVAPLGGGTAAPTSVGSCTGNGVSVFVPLIVFVPSLNATFIEVRSLLPATTSVTTFVLPAATLVGAVMVNVGAVPPFA
jgi:hypothetical protein